MIATNAFKQAVVGTYTNSDTVIELNSISNTIGNADYLPNGGFNLILYDGLFGNPADANNAGKYEILECSSVNYATNEITVVRARENTTAVTIDASSWQVVYGATVAFFAQFEDADATILKQADVVDTLVSTSITAPLSANQGKVLQDGKEPADATILKQANIVDNLTSTSTTAPLSANQGKQLEDTKIATSAIVNDLTTGGATNVASAETVKTLQDGKLNLSGGTMTGDLTIPDKIIHSGDTNTAIRFPANDTVTVETAGVERVRVDSSGNLLIGSSTLRAIGTASPLIQSEVNSAIWTLSNIRNTNDTLPAAVSFAKSRGTTSGSVTTVQNNDGIGALFFYGANGSNMTNLAAFIRVDVDGVVSGGGVNDMPGRIVFATTPDNSITPAERMRITSAGNVGIGTTTPATALDVSGSIRSSVGILFGTDTAAANTLDDYEEGVWTPGVSFGGASVGVTYNALTSGTFTKIGNLVSVQGFFILSNKGSSTGDAKITGLPFLASSVARFPAVALRFDNISFANQFQGNVSDNSTTIDLRELTEAGVESLITDADFTNTSIVNISCTYKV